MSGEYTRQDFDELVARLKKLEPPTVTDCLGLVIGYTDLLAERDALAAELVALRAGLPRWRLQDNSSNQRGQWWQLGYVSAAEVGYNVFTVSYDHNTVTTAELCSGDYASARKRAEALLGLPPCEVEGE